MAYDTPKETEQLNIMKNATKETREDVVPGIEATAVEDPNLKKAFEESFQTNSYLPLLKQELRMKIQYQRLEKGETELKIEFKESPRYSLTEEEILKRNRRRAQNRESAIRCRNKRKCLERQLQNELAALEENQRHLMNVNDELKREKDMLEKWLDSHSCTQTDRDRHQSPQKFVSLLNRRIVHSAA